MCISCNSKNAVLLLRERSGNSFEWDGFSSMVEDRDRTVRTRLRFCSKVFVAFLLSCLQRFKARAAIVCFVEKGFVRYSITEVLSWLCIFFFTEPELYKKKIIQFGIRHIIIFFNVYCHFLNKTYHNWLVCWDYNKFNFCNIRTNIWISDQTLKWDLLNVFVKWSRFDLILDLLSVV
jgi:hypothetical protein